MNEIWRDIEGYEGLYQVSNLGKVKSLGNEFSRKEKILKQGKNKDGYLYVNLCKEGKIKTCTVHRLVAIAFIPNPSNLSTVNHIDENKENNCVDNLEWMNISQQQRHGTCQQRRVEKVSRQVFQYTKNRTLVAIWESTNEAGRNGYIQSAVSACCLGKRKSHRGYIWSYTHL